MIVFSKGPSQEDPGPTTRAKPAAGLGWRTFCVVLSVCLLGGFEAFEWSVQNHVTQQIYWARMGENVCTFKDTPQMRALLFPRFRLVLRGVLFLPAFAQLCRWLYRVQSRLQDPPGRRAIISPWRYSLAVLRHPWRVVADIVTLGRRGQTLIVLWWLLWGAYLLCSLALVAVTCSIGISPRVPLTDMRHARIFEAALRTPSPAGRH